MLIFVGTLFITSAGVVRVWASLRLLSLSVALTWVSLRQVLRFRFRALESEPPLDQAAHEDDPTELRFKFREHASESLLEQSLEGDPSLLSSGLKFTFSNFLGGLRFGCPFDLDEDERCERFEVEGLMRSLS